MPSQEKDTKWVIRGKIFDTNFQQTPVSGVKVQIWGRGLEQSMDALSNVDGEYEFALLPGHYSIFLYKEGYEYTISPLEVTAESSQSSATVIKEGMFVIYEAVAKGNVLALKHGISKEERSFSERYGETIRTMASLRNHRWYIGFFPCQIFKQTSTKIQSGVNMSKQKLNFAFIGCGGNARGHGRSVSSVEDVEIVALADPSAGSLDAFKETVGLDDALPTYADHVEMLAAAKPDAVVISSPHGLHFQHIMDALDAGCHVHTEKPMVCTVDHAKQVIAKVEETGLHLMIGYQRHLSPTYQYCRKVVQSGELGRVNFVSAHQSQNWYRNQQGKWRQDPFLGGGGQLNDSGSHLIDILLWVLEASPDTVFAMIDNLDIEVDVLTAMSIKFDTGALCNISIVGHAYGGVREAFSIWLEEGALYLREGKLLRQEQSGSPEPVDDSEMPASGNKDVAFIQLIRGERTENPIGVENGLRVIQLTEAAWQSAELGRPVKVDLS